MVVVSDSEYERLFPAPKPAYEPQVFQDDYAPPTYQPPASGFSGFPPSDGFAPTYDPTPFQGYYQQPQPTYYQPPADNFTYDLQGSTFDPSGGYWQPYEDPAVVRSVEQNYVPFQPYEMPARVFNPVSGDYVNLDDFQGASLGDIGRRAMAPFDWAAEAGADALPIAADLSGLGMPYRGLERLEDRYGGTWTPNLPDLPSSRSALGETWKNISDPEQAVGEFRSRPWTEQLAAGAVFDPLNLVGVGKADEILDVARRIPAVVEDVAPAVRRKAGEFVDVVRPLLRDERGELRFRPDRDPEITPPGPGDIPLEHTAAQRAGLEFLAQERGIRRSGEAAEEIAAGRRTQVGGINDRFTEGEAAGLTGKPLADEVRKGARVGTMRQTLPEAIADEHLPHLYNAIHEAKKAVEITDFEWLQAVNAMDSLVRNQNIQPAQEKLLRQIWGDEILISLKGRVGKLKVENPADPFPTRAMDLGELTPGVQSPLSEAPLGNPAAFRERISREAGEWRRDRMARRMAPLPDRSGVSPLSIREQSSPIALSEAPVGDPAAFRDRVAKEVSQWRQRRMPPPAERPGVASLSMREQGSPIPFSEATPATGPYKSGPVRKPHTITPGAILGMVKEAGMEALLLPRALKSSIDFSATLRQGAVLGAGHPQVVPRSFVAQLKAFGSERVALKLDKALDARPNARIHREAGLYRAPLDKAAKLTEREESFLSRFAGRIPLVRNSERAYVTYLNYVRTGSFDAVWNGLDPLDQSIENATALARFMNVASGRGELGGVLDGSGPLLAAAFYSPRNLVSRPQAIWMMAKPGQPGFVRREAMKTLAAYFTATSTLLAMGKFGGVWEVELDPRSADFGKGRIGPLRFDPWTGYSQLSRTFAQVITGERKSTTTGRINKIDREDALGNFTRAKLAPVPGAAWTQLTGSDFLGKAANRDPLAILSDLYSPITPQDIKQSYDAYGWEMALLTLPAILGLGVQVHEPSAYDVVAREKFGKPYDALEEHQRAQVRGDTRVRAEMSPTATLAQNVRAEYERYQLGDDELLAKGELTGEKWRAFRGERLNALGAAMDIIYRDLPPQEKQTPLGKFYEYRESLKVNGRMPDEAWDKLDAYTATLSQTDREYITRNTGLYGTPTETQYLVERQKIEDSGYWELRDNLWAKLNAGSPAPGYKAGEGYYDWKDGRVEEARLEMVAAGMSKLRAESEAQEKIESHPVYGPVIKAFEGAGAKPGIYKTQTLYPWADAHREEFTLLVKWGYMDNPDAQLEKLLDLIAGAQ